MGYIALIGLGVEALVFTIDTKELSILEYQGHLRSCRIFGIHY